ncbi:hypothetical protein Tco_0800259, partial [Tanacetum coccineum]
LRLKNSINCVYEMSNGRCFDIGVVDEIVEDIGGVGGGGGSCVGDSAGVEESCDSCVVGSCVEVLSVDKSLVEVRVGCKSRVVGEGKKIFVCGGLGDGSKWVKPMKIDGIALGANLLVKCWFGWKSVYEISGCKYAMSLKMKWKIGLKSECSSYLKKLFVFSLNHCILLRGVGT